jgi:hypothetical protein
VRKRQKVKTYFLPVCLGFETRQSLASNRVAPTQNPSGSIWQWGYVAFTPKKGTLCLSFFADQPAKK